MFRFVNRLRATKYSDIDYILDKERLIELFNTTYEKNLDVKLKIISYLFNLGFYDISKDHLNQVFKQFSDSVFSNIRWYKINLAIAIEDNDDFSIKTIIKRLKDDFKKPSFYYDFIIQKDIKIQMEIFNNEILPIIHKVLNTDLLDFCLIAYEWSRYQNPKHISLSKVEKKLNRRISDIKTKPKHSIHDILFIENLTNAIITNHNNNHYSIEKFSKRIDSLEVSIKIIDLYFVNFNDKKRRLFEDMFNYSNQLLYEITSDIKYDNNIRDFSLKHRALLSTFYLYASKRYQKDKGISFIDVLKKLCEEKNRYHIIDLFLFEMSNNNWDELIKSKDVVVLMDDEEIKEIVNAMLLYIEFIQGSKISKDNVDRLLKVIRVPLIVEYAMNYENDLISEAELDTKIRELGPIPSSLKQFIRLYNSFYKNYDFERLLLLLCEKIDIKKSDTERIFYFLLLKIYNNEIILNYYEFERLVAPVMNLDSFEVDNLIIQIAIVYKTFSNKYISLIVKNLGVLSNTNTVSYDYERMTILMYNYLLFCIQYNKSYELPDIKDAFCKVIQTRISERKPALFLVLGQIYPKVVNDNYFDIVSYLSNQYLNDISKWSELDITIYKLLFLEQLEKPNSFELEEDIIYMKDNKFYAKYHQGMEDFYNTLNIEVVQDFNVEEYDKLSLIHGYISRTVFNNAQHFGLLSIPISMEASGQEILKEMGKYIGWDKTQKNMDEFNNGRGKAFIFNVFTEHSLFKNIQQMYDDSLNSKMFTKIDNSKIFLGLPKIIHPCSLILLAVIDALVIIERNKSCYIFESVFDDITTKYSFQINDLADGVLDRRVYFEDSLERLSKLMLTLKEEDRVIILPMGSLFSNNLDEKFHKYDVDTIKVILQRKENQIKIISDDSYYYQADAFINISTGSFSLAVEAYYYGYIDDGELLRITRELSKLNYSSLFSPNLVGIIFNQLEKEGKSKNIEEVFSIISRAKDF